MHADAGYYLGIFAVYGLNGLTLALPLALGAARAAASLKSALKERLRARALRRAAAGRGLVEGTVVRGPRDESGTPDVVSVEIHQKGAIARDSGSDPRYAQGPSVPSAHVWVETARAVRARRFQVLLGSGAVVHIEADARTKIHKDDVMTRWVGDKERLRRTTIAEGERVIVEGTLEKGQEADGDAGYRGRRRDVIHLVGAPEAPLVITTGSLGAAHLRRAKFEGRRAALAASLLVFLQGYVFIDYTRFFLFGPSALRHAARFVAVDIIPSTADPSLRALGGYPAPNPIVVLLTSIAALVTAYVALRLRYEPPWYEQARVEDHGFGPLR